MKPEHAYMWPELRFGLVGRTGFEPVTSSVSGNAIYHSCFRIFILSCDVSSACVHGRLSRSAAIVTQLVTQSLRGLVVSCPACPSLRLGPT